MPTAIRTALWLLVLAVINPFSFLWLYAAAQVWSHDGWHAVAEAING